MAAAWLTRLFPTSAGVSAIVWRASVREWTLKTRSQPLSSSQPASLSCTVSENKNRTKKKVFPFDFCEMHSSLTGAIFHHFTTAQRFWIKLICSRSLSAKTCFSFQEILSLMSGSSLAQVDHLILSPKTWNSKHHYWCQGTAIMRVILIFTNKADHVNKTHGFACFLVTKMLIIFGDSFGRDTSVMEISYCDEYKLCWGITFGLRKKQTMHDLSGS